MYPRTPLNEMITESNERFNLLVKRYARPIIATTVGGFLTYFCVTNFLTWTVVLHVFAWIAFWCALHVAVPLIVPGFLYILGRKECAKVVREDYLHLNGTKRAYWRRLVRSQFYYAFAAIAGWFLLLTKYDLIAYFTLDRDARPVEGMLETWNASFEIPFAVAVAHWCLSFVEDYACRDLLSADIQNAKMPNGSKVKLEFDADKALFSAYCVHHIVTAGAYLWCLETHSLSALCVLGLVFEMPVIFMNLREFVVTFDKDMGGIIKNKIDTKFLPTTWNFILFTVLGCRYNATLIYIWSLIFWRDEVAELGPSSWFAYHILAIFFSVLNMYLTGLLFVWANQDMRKVKECRLSDARGELDKILDRDNKNGGGGGGGDSKNSGDKNDDENDQLICRETKECCHQNKNDTKYFV